MEYGRSIFENGTDGGTINLMMSITGMQALFKMVIK